MPDTREENIGRRNVTLRRELRALHETADVLFTTLCSRDTGAAETAMGELWGSGHFDCGPQDYAYIVEQCLEALGMQRRTNPVIVSRTMCATD